MPCLRHLRITYTRTSNAIIAGLLGAAGPNLRTLDIPEFSGGLTAAQFIVAEDYPWLSSLQTLFVDSDNPQMLATVLGRLPSLNSLQVASLSHDELLVHLMAAADSGTLLQSLDLELQHVRGECNVNNGARLLLVLWLKGESKKAMAGQAAVKWKVWFLGYGRPYYISKVTDKCLHLDQGGVGAGGGQLNTWGVE